MGISSCASGGRSPRTVSPERALAQPPRYKSACESCHSSKVRCTGKQPCQRCASNGWNCVYKFASRIGKPKGSRNKSTLRRLQMEAEQAERESARQSVSTTSTRSSSLPVTPITATAVPGALSLAGIEGTVPSSSMPTGLADWSWPFNSKTWTFGSGGDTPFSTTIEASGSVEWELPVHPGITVDAAVLAGEQRPSNVEAVQPLIMPQPNLMFFSESGTKDLNSIASAAASSRWPDDANEGSAWSTSQSIETIDRGMTLPSYSWLQEDSGRTTSYHDSNWALYSCPCEQNLSSQIHRLDLLREALTINTTLRASIYETDESVSSIHSFFECQICEKDSSCLSLAVHIFNKINQLFMRSLHEAVGLTGVPLQHRPNAPTVLANSAERLSEDSPAMTLLRRWLRLCEHALRLVEALQRQALLRLESNPGQPITQHTTSGADHRAAFWSSSDLASFSETLWRVQSSLSEQV